MENFSPYVLRKNNKKIIHYSV